MKEIFNETTSDKHHEGTKGHIDFALRQAENFLIKTLPKQKSIFSR